MTDTLARKIEFYINGAKSGGVNALLDGTSSAPPSESPAMMAGDKCALSLFFRKRAADNGESTDLAVPTGSTIVAAGKIATPDGALLFVSSGFAKGSGENWDGTIDLNTEPIATAMASVQNGQALEMYIDIEVRDATNTERLTFRVPCRLFKQVYEDGVAPSAVVLPAAIVPSPDGARWQLGATNEGQPTLTRIS